MTGLIEAVLFRRFGGIDELEVGQLPSPTPQADEIAVDVAAASINPTDLLMLEGKQRALMADLAPPFVAGMEFSGRIANLGGRVAGWSTGQRVMGLVNPRRPAGGAQATLICVPASSVLPVPQPLDMLEAATLPMNGLTALLCLDSLGLSPGQVVLVTGGAGMVGGYFIALARRAGLRVVADALPADRELVAASGADQLVARGPGMAAAVRELHPNGVDGLVDAALLGAVASSLVREGGAVVSLRRGQGGTDPRLRHEYVRVLQHSQNLEALSVLGERIADGTLRPRIAARFPLSRVREAYELARQSGLRGRVVLEMAGPDRTRQAHEHAKT